MSSRSIKVLKNAKIALLFFFITLTLNFVSRAVFIKYLGSDLVGLSTLASNLMGFLNLAELGIVSAVASSLYKPIHDNDKQSLIEIITIQGWLYRKVAYIVTFGAVVLMAFFPIIFKKVNLPFWYPYSLFLVLLTSSLLTYFITYKQILLIAELKEYKINIVTKSITILKVSLQIICVTKFSNPFNIWLALEFLFGVLSSVILNLIISKEYPWLNTELKNGRSFSNKHPEILLNIKQLLFHKLGEFVLLQTIPLIIYYLISLNAVTIYTNYLIIINGLTGLFIALFSSFQAGIGNYTISHNNKKVVELFWEFQSCRYALATIVVTILYYQTSSFISLWVGHDYVMEKNAFICLLALTFINLSRIIEIFLNSYKLFSDIYAPLAEAIINLGLSFILGYYYGLSGILLGSFISLIIIVCIWKPYFLYIRGFRVKYSHYLYKILFNIFATIISLILILLIENNFSIHDKKIESYFDWLFQTTVIGFINSVIILVVYLFIIDDFRKLFSRIINLVKIRGDM